MGIIRTSAIKNADHDARSPAGFSGLVIGMFEDSAPGPTTGIDGRRADARIDAAARYFPGQSVGGIVDLGGLVTLLSAGGDP